MRKRAILCIFGLFFAGNSVFAQLQVKNSVSTVLMQVTQSGNVGIGIGDATPAARLHSNGTVRLAGSLGTATTADMNVLIHQIDGDVMPRALAANVWDGDNQQLSISGNTLSLTDGGSVPLPLGIGGSGVATRVSFWNTASTLGSDANLFWDNSNDRLGIGTTAPQAALHSTGTLRLSGALGTATTADMNVLIRQSDGDVMPRALAANVWDGDNQQLSISGTTLSLTDGGSVTLPSGVGGSGVATRVAFWNTGSTLSSDAALYWNNSNKRLGIGATSPQATLHSLGTVRLEGTLGTATTADMNVLIRQSDGDVMPRALGADVWDGDNQTLSISGNNLSISGGNTVTLPTWIDGSGAATRVAFWQDGNTITSNSALFWDNSNARLGVGTSTPGVGLEISKTASVALRLRDTGVAVPYYDFDLGQFSTVNGYLALQTNSTSTANFMLTNTNSSRVMNFLLEQDASIGIGTTNPQAAIHIVSHGWPDNFIYMDANAPENGDTGTRLYYGGAVKWHLYNDHDRLGEADPYCIVAQHADATQSWFIFHQDGHLSIDHGGITTGGASTFGGNVTINGNLTASGTKNFDIADPRYGDADKRLVHSCLEGPEAGVYYRGTARLHDGAVEIVLPDYFEALTRTENRTVQLTCEKGWSPLYVDGEVQNGKFIVKTAPGGGAEQKFFWEVKAVRKDVPALTVEYAK